ncbi:hypothetical protein [Hymenobacter koreensis]|uniref:AI-2E family transporter n=1 Tax=Hymenobacter koreensis TaxID=1084523 RepID=A0ABP8J373_9BACT
MAEKILKSKTSPANVLSWIFGVVVVIIGVLNLLLVHAVPGAAYLLVSLLYFPPTNTFLKEKVGFGIPGLVKILLGIVIIQFTLGVSDLGDMLDKWTL